MYLIVAATRLELEPFLRALPKDFPCGHLVTGVGLVETTLRLSNRLAAESGRFHGVINLGVAGAYVRDAGGAELLDLCLAEREVLGDLGICDEASVESIRSDTLEIQDTFSLDSEMLKAAEVTMRTARIEYRRGVFVTVNCASGSGRRAALLARRHDAICENMEGAAAARVCDHYRLPLLELRCVSNLVVDRDVQRWQLREACVRCGEAAALLVTGWRHAH